MLFALPALNDNYIWLYQRENSPLIIVDLPETDKLFAWLDAQNVTIEASVIRMCRFMGRKNARKKVRQTS